MDESSRDIVVDVDGKAAGLKVDSISEFCELMAKAERMLPPDLAGTTV